MRRAVHVGTPLWSMLAAFAVVACDRPAAPPPSPPTAAVRVERLTGWTATESGAMVGVGDDLGEGVTALRRELAAATDEAQRTLGEARRRFEATPDAERNRWAVKWAAPIRRGIAAGQTEHVWIRPVRWTEHRVEGVLASEPLRAIGVRLGDLVGVPVDEISDWVHTPDAPVSDGIGERREGGFTIAVLERFAGPPPK